MVVHRPEHAAQLARICGTLRANVNLIRYNEVAGLPYQRPKADDVMNFQAILRNNGVHAFGLPWVQAEIGMPFKIDGFVRGISYQGLTIAGGGLRYSLRKVADMPWAPQRAWNDPDVYWMSLVSFVNWVCNVLMPVYAAVEVTAATGLTFSAFAGRFSLMGLLLRRKIAVRFRPFLAAAAVAPFRGKAAGRCYRSHAT